MNLQSKLRDAVNSEASWDVHGLLADAADRIDSMEKFLKSLLNPEENGHAVSAYVRDEARVVLGRKPVERASY